MKHYPASLLLATLLGLASLFSVALPLQAVTPAKVNQSIGFAPRSSYFFGTPPIELHAVASSGLPVSFTVLSGPATVQGNFLTLTGAGLVQLEVDAAGNATYLPRRIIRNIISLKASQSILFPPIEGQVYGDSPATIVYPTATSGLPVTLTVTGGPGSLQGNILSSTGVGLIRLTASQEGNADYAPASNVSVNVPVPAVPVITSPKTTQGTVGKPFSFQITSTGSPASFTLAGQLPAGLIFNSSKGIISGTPTQVASVNLIVGAAASQGTGKTSIRLRTVADVPYIFAGSGIGTVGEYTLSGTVIDKALITQQKAPTSLSLRPAISITTADGFVYVGSYDRISKYTTSGEVVNYDFITGLDRPIHLAISGSTLYVLSNPGIFGQEKSTWIVSSYTTSGEPINSALIKDLKTPTGLQVTAAGIFIPSSSTNLVAQYSLNGVRLKASLIKGLSGAGNLAITDSAIYVLNKNIGTVGKYALTGRPINTALVTGLVQPLDLTVLGETLYVANGNSSIGSYSTAGATLNPSLITGLDSLTCLAIDKP